MVFGSLYSRYLSKGADIMGMERIYNLGVLLRGPLAQIASSDRMVRSGVFLETRDLYEIH